MMGHLKTSRQCIALHAKMVHIYPICSVQDTCGTFYCGTLYRLKLGTTDLQSEAAKLKGKKAKIRKYGWRFTAGSTGMKMLLA